MVMLSRGVSGDVVVVSDERPTCTFFRRLWSCDDCDAGRRGVSQRQQQRAWVTEQKHVSGSPTYDSRKVFSCCC